MTLKEFRLSKGWTQETMAEKIGAEQALYSKWERRVTQPSTGYMERISRVTHGAVTERETYRLPVAEHA
jgi:transcriptional regulator with XRE-family HTH domain